MNAVLRLLLSAALLASPAAFAAGAVIGERLPESSLEDAHGKKHVIGDGLRRIYTTADRKGDKLLEAAMAGLDQSALNAQGAAVVADISDAPFFVKGIIRSSLRDRRYNTWVDASGATRATLAYRENRVTILELDQRRVTAIRHIDNVEALKRELALPPAPVEPAPAAAPGSP